MVQLMITWERLSGYWSLMAFVSRIDIIAHTLGSLTSFYAASETVAGNRQGTASNQLLTDPIWGFFDTWSAWLFSRVRNQRLWFRPRRGRVGICLCFVGRVDALSGGFTIVAFYTCKYCKHSDTLNTQCSCKVSWWTSSDIIIYWCDRYGIGKYFR